jgi:hypothetical protein
MSMTATPAILQDFSAATDRDLVSVAERLEGGFEEFGIQVLDVDL